MRKILLNCLLGLVGVSTIAGCGLLGRSRDGCSDGRCASKSAKKDCAICQVTVPANGNAQTPTIRVEGAITSKEVGLKVESPPVLGTVTTAEPELMVQVIHQQDVAQAPKRVNSVVETRDAVAEELAIVNREVAALRDRPAKKALDKTPGVQALPKMEPIVTTQCITTNPAIDSIPHHTNGTMPMPHENAAKEKIITLKSIDIHYGEKDNYKSITGKVEQYRKNWRLRYGSIDQEDAHGGVVVLEGGADLSQLREGQHIRVTGVIVPPATRTSSASYRVQTVEILD